MFVYTEGVRVQPRVDNIYLTVAICNPEYSYEVNTVLVGLLWRIKDGAVARQNRRRYFCAVYDYAVKADLGKAYRNPERKLGVTTHF